MSSSQAPSFADHFLRLPRELRDLIYPHIVTSPSPRPIQDPHCHAIASYTHSHPTIAAEAQEASYLHNTFIIDLSKKRALNPTYHPSIRHLIVGAHEPSFPHSPNATPEELETICQTLRSRTKWEALLTIPHLETLEVRMEKVSNDEFFWMVFTPILYQLRSQRPNIKITFFISFNYLLEMAWNDAVWDQFTGNFAENDDEYEPMGMIDISESFEPPTQADWEFVAEYLPEERVGLGMRSRITSGLLAEVPAMRVMLGKHYLVKDPAFLRVQAQRHYEVYKALETKVKKGDSKAGEITVEYPRI